MVFCRDCGKPIRAGDCSCRVLWGFALGGIVGMVLGLFAGIFVPLIWR